MLMFDLEIFEKYLQELLTTKYSSYALNIIMILADIDLQRKFYIKWQNRCLDWKTLKLEESIQNHKYVFILF